MKYLKSLAATICLLAIVGCATQQTAAFKTYAVSRVTAHEALVFWNSYLGSTSHKPTQDTERQVLKVYNDWRASMAVVADAGAVWSAASHNKEATQSNVDAALAAFNQAVSSSAVIQSDFIHLVSKITGSPL